MSLHRHEKRTEHWSIVEGIATITLGNETADYNKYESVFIPVGTKHRIANKTDKNVVVIEVGIGDNISDTDLVKIYNKDNPQASANYVRLIRVLLRSLNLHLRIICGVEPRFVMYMARNVIMMSSVRAGNFQLILTVRAV